MLEPAKDHGKSAAQRIAASRERLNAAYGIETVEATQACPLAGGPKVAPHAGRCKLCEKTPVDPAAGTVHSIARTPEAIAEVNRLRDEIKAKGLVADGTDRSKDIPHSAFRADGNMLGVLLCFDPVEKKTVMLKSFSGVAGNTGKMDVPGYSPYLATNPPGLYDQQVAVVERTTARLEEISPQPKKKGDKATGPLVDARAAVAAEQDRILREKRGITGGMDELTRRTTEAGAAYGKARKEHGQKKAALKKAKAAKGDASDAAAREAAVATLEAEVAAAARDETAKKAAMDMLRAQMPRPSKLTSTPPDHASTLDKRSWDEQVLKNEVKQLEKERKAAEKARDSANDKMQVPNFTGGPASNLADVCIDETGKKHLRTGTCGQCAAPKLLAEAHALGLTPISMAETWLGGGKGSQSEGGPVESCENCRSFIGAAVCGLHEKQKAEIDAIDAGAKP